jgi:chromosome segregation ATPase
MTVCGTGAFKQHRPEEAGKPLIQVGETGHEPAATRKETIMSDEETMIDEQETEEQTQVEPAISEALGAETPQAKPQWDKDRQTRDEIAGLNRNVRELQEKLEAAEAAKNEVEEDDDTYEGLVAKVNKYKNELLETRTELKEVKTTVASVSQLAQQQAGEKELNNFCAPLDKKYGAQFRSEVLTQANEEFESYGIVAASKEAQQKWIRNRITELYERKAASSGKPAPKTPANAPNVSTGTGGAGATSAKGGIKPGTKQEVRQQLLAQGG